MKIGHNYTSASQNTAALPLEEARETIWQHRPLMIAKMRASEELWGSEVLGNKICMWVTADRVRAGKISRFDIFWKLPQGRSSESALYVVSWYSHRRHPASCQWMEMRKCIYQMYSSKNLVHLFLPDSYERHKLTLLHNKSWVWEDPS